MVIPFPVTRCSIIRDRDKKIYRSVYKGLTELLTVRYISFMHESMDTKSLLLAQALELFALRGYESVGTQEIVQRSGVTKPTLYHYFGSKRGLLEALLEVYGGEYLQDLERAAHYGHDLTATLNALTREELRYALANPFFYRLIMTLSVAAPESESYGAYRPLKERLNRLYEALFAAASEDHGNMKGRQRAYSESFQSMLRAWTMLALNHETELDAPAMERVVHHFMHGIFS